MPDVTCLVCGCAAMQAHLEILLKCPSCGFVTARLDRTINARGLYEGSYFTGKEYVDYPGDEALFKKTFSRRLRSILRRRSAGRLLEIGAAYGFFLELAAEHFQVVGYEVNAEAARFARDTLGLDVRTSDFLEAGADDVGGPVDVTVMWDVTEHLERPDLFLARIAQLSSPGALLCITTGDIGSRLARWRGRKWRLIHPPTHLHYFDRQTLTRLLDNCGFRVLEIHTEGVARSIRQVLYSVFVLGMHLPGVYRTMEKVVPARWGFTLNTFDIMHVVAERKDDAKTS